VLTDGLGWRWVFFINLPLGLLTALLAHATFPRDERPLGAGPRIDGVGIGLLVVSLASVQVVLEQGRQLDWLVSPLIRQLTLLALVTLPAFVVWEPLATAGVDRHRCRADGAHPAAAGHHRPGHRRPP
jgi:DHA2 family multidrug resistance protein